MPYEPQDEVCQRKINSLVDNISRNGLAHPLMVYKYNKNGKKWAVKEGGHRCLALKKMGVCTALCVDVTQDLENWKKSVFTIR